MPKTITDPVQALRAEVQRFVRGFGLLAPDTTPCGKPLSTSHAHALMVLLDAHGAADGLAQQTLVGALGIDKSNVARLCARMAKAGHVEQVVSPLDGRSRLVRLTAKGARLARQVDDASRSLFARVHAAVPTSERAHLRRALATLNEAVLSIKHVEEKP